MPPPPQPQNLHPTAVGNGLPPHAILWRIAKNTWHMFGRHMLDKILILVCANDGNLIRDSTLVRLLEFASGIQSRCDARRTKIREVSRSTSASKIVVVNIDRCCQAASVICLSCLNHWKDPKSFVNTKGGERRLRTRNSQTCRHRHNPRTFIQLQLEMDCRRMQFCGE